MHTDVHLLLLVLDFVVMETRPIGEVYGVSVQNNRFSFGDTYCECRILVNDFYFFIQSFIH